MAGKHPVSKALFFNILQGKKNAEMFGYFGEKSYLCIHKRQGKATGLEPC